MKQSRITGAISLVLSQAAILVFGYATHLWIGRVLGPATYGIYGVVLSIQTIFGIFLTLGIPMAVSRFVAQDEEHAQSIVRQALRIQAWLAALVTVGVFIASPIIARLLKDTALTRYIIVIAGVLFFQAFYPIVAQFLSGMHRFNRQAILTTFYAILKLLGAIGLMYVFGIYGALLGFAVGGVAATVLGWSWIKKLGGSKEHPLPIKSFLSFAGTYVFITAGLQLLISLDLLMVKALLNNDTQAGFYNAAVTLSRISYLLLQGLAFILLPSVSALTKHGSSGREAGNFIRDTLRYLIALIVPSVALAAATSKELIILFFSRDYIPAAPALSILMVGLGSLGFYLLLVNIVAGAGRARVGLITTVVLVVISAVLGTILIPRYGLVGAAWQTTIAGVAGLIFLTWYTFRTFRIPLPIRSTINVLIAAAVAVAPTYLWKATPLMLPVQYALLGFLYFAVLLVLGEIQTQDWERVATLHPLLQRLKPHNS